jgi:hypothetical protein
MKDAEEIQEKADELADRVDKSDGRDSSAWAMRMALDWVLETIDDI